MPLHRDIFWVGKQWSVTGYGVQAIDQKLKGKFDIETSRVWDDDLSDALLDVKWFNSKDFDKAIVEARKRHPNPHPNRKAAPKAAPAMVTPPPDDVVPAKPPPKANAAAKASASAKAGPSAKVKPASAPAEFAMRIEGCRAKFLPAWRIRVRGQR